ncbi:integrase [Helicobacter pullorum]|uniref:Tyrosine recombinase XerH n=1 Tax=Helicobacter pullorum TaxID=35818 RepID=A0A0N0LS54_9HELI|nr:tyrosine-type recombinase/integrase [Helicobacter pullorum]HIS09081.1 tyrosine-type recombinase/integrase [Candidatus Scatomorpha intestinipullorum]KAB0575785.1 tyrosine-type recombinase/integrase [Helicobacter pullorum NCTC 12824]KPH51253.1 integrase [Helicobacter pullorum]KPH53932.1 integrase [Helicobacter pullorum]KPH56196.1 integrase [Helicobacter pullorum]
MRYPIDFKDDFAQNLLFWIERFVYSKLNSLSNHQVQNKKDIILALNALRKGAKSIQELQEICKQCRNAGLIGINTYFTPLMKLYEYLNYLGLASLKEVDEEMLKEFLTIHTSSLSDATKKNYRIALINFFGFIDKQNEDDDSTSYIFRIELKNWGGLRGKSGQKLPSYMNEEEVQRFLNGIETYPFKHQDLGARNRLLLKTIIYTGIRVGEALNLKIKDIMLDGEFYVIQVKGKGNKPRVVMIKAKNIHSDFGAWINSRPLEVENELLFCNHKAKKLTQAYVSRIVEQVLLTNGIRKEKNGAHMLRHSFATLLYQKSQDLVLVQEALGHASLDTSRIYTHFDKQKLKATTEIM